PVLAAAVMTTVPLPVAFSEAVRNEELLVAIQLQLLAAVTSTLTVPPPLLALALVVDSVTEHPLGADSTTAACVNTTAVPLTTMLADRAPPVLAAMLYPTEPFPVPEAPDVTVIKLALLTAVHAHVDAAVTAIVPDVAAALTLVVALPSVTEQELVVVVVGEVSLFEHAAAARATAADTTESKRSRGRRFISPIV